MLHIADCNPTAALSPTVGSTERAQLYRWMSFLATNVYEGLLRVLYPDMYTTASDLDAITESAYQYLQAAFSIVDQQLVDSPCLVGNRTGIAELYLAMLLTWHPDQARLYEAYPNLLRVLEDSLALEGVRAVFEANELL
jgi:glutathione S-transferase